MGLFFMLDNVDLDKLAKIKYRQGFSLLVINLTKFVANYDFIEYESLLCQQSTIQKFSYVFVDHLFAGNRGFSMTGKQMQMYLTKIDITEIGVGAVDLSHPNLTNTVIDTDQAHSLIQQNDVALAYLKKPFNEGFRSLELTEKLTEVTKTLSQMNEVDHPTFILDFLTLQKKHLASVLLFCQVLNLVCLSQSLYAFSYQIKSNQNFVRIIELILLLDDVELTGIEHVQKLAERFFQIFRGNLTARVFSHQTLEIVEKALSTGANK